MKKASTLYTQKFHFNKFNLKQVIALFMASVLFQAAAADGPGKKNKKNTNGQFRTDVCAPLSGSYTINQALPSGGTNFHSFNDFADSLTACGVGGHVTATVAAGTGPYEEQVIFENIPGIGAAASVTIQGNGETITSDTAINQTGSNPNRHIIRLINLQYFNINSLHVDMFPGSTGFMGIHIYSTGSNITISNCVVNMGTGTSTLLGGIAATGSQSSLLSGGTFSNLSITGNTTTAGGYGVVCYGLSNGTSINNIINNNTFNGSSSNGIYVQQNGGLIIRSNTVNFTSGNGIQVAGSGNINTLVEKNFISCNNASSTSTLRGIYVFGSNPGSPNKIVNNVIRNMNAPLATISGITNRTTGAEFYFNSVVLDASASSGGRTMGFEEDLSNLGSLLRNNIFYITRNSTNYGAALALAGSSNVTSAVNSNYNVFFTAGGAHVAVKKGVLSTDPPNATYSTLPNWQAASTQDPNSLQTNPLFQPGTAIPQSGVINGAGIAVAGITTDITGAARSNPPDPGAYEFSPPGDDAAITNFVMPAIPHCATTLVVQFVLTNAGGNTLNTVTINWTANGVPQPVVNWSGPPLASGQSTTVTLGTVTVTGTNTYNFSATASNPNGGPDANPANDSYTFNGFRRGMEGSFTINVAAPASSTNYQSFQAIANELSQYGVCTPVTITVLNGPYNQQVVFHSIPGTSAVNTVTLNGNSQILNFNPSDPDEDHILQLNGVNYMIVQNLTVASLHPTQGRGIHITNNASKLVISNNTVQVSTTNSTSSAFGIIVSGENWLLDGSLSDSVVISNNTVTGGYSGIQLSGEHWTQPLTKMIVTGNSVLDWYGYGIYLSYTNNAFVSKNMIRRPTRTNSGSDAVTPAGITVPAGSLGFLLEKNKIYDLHVSMPQSSTISRGIYMSGTGIAPTSGTIQNNLIYGMNNDGAQYGIQNNSVNGPVNIYHNTIVLNNATSASTSNTNAIHLSNFSTQTGCDIRNNIFYVTRGGSGNKRIFNVDDASTSFTSNTNAMYLNAPGGTQMVGKIGSNIYTTFSDWQTLAGKDLNSVFSDPVFSNPAAGNYQPTHGSVDGSSMGTASVGVADDILDVVRSANPDPGAYEFVPVCSAANGGTANTSSGPFCSSGSGTITATGYSTGTGISYQWQYSSDNFNTDIHDLSGQSNPASAVTGTITATTYYRLKVTCVAGPLAYSTIAVIVVHIPVSISVHPLSQTVCIGAAVSFSVTAAGSNLTYQWRKNGSAISGATAATYSIPVVASADAGSYDVTVTGSCGSVTSSQAVLIVNATTAITVQPPSQFVCAGASVTFSVTATGISLTYQWRKNGTNISGATSSSYNLNNVAASDAGNYDVLITGTCGQVTSQTALLSVTANGTWIGITSSDWNTASNWCGGIPTAVTDIFIPASAPNMPNLSSGTGTARSISIMAGSSLTVSGGATLEIYGDVLNNGVWNAATGHLLFKGSVVQSIPSFTSIHAGVNGAGILLNGNASVTGTLTLTNGHITLGSHQLTLANSASGSVASHVITNGTGKINVTSLVASSSRTIPAGFNAATYNPVVLAAGANHSTDHFSVSVAAGVYVNGGSGSLFTTDVVDRTWTISEATPGGSNVDITLQWIGSEELSGFQRNRSQIMRHNGSTWVNGPATGAGGNNPYTQTLTAVTAFSAFAVRTEPLPRPKTGVYPNPAKSEINVVLDLNADTPVTFTIYDTRGGLVKQFSQTVLSGLSKTTLDIRNLASGAYVLKLSTVTVSELLLAQFVKMR